ncbi:hypothetical protein [uncultured Aquitalea sp.]|uniref:hypothetical protein n=1 Tax=uncultured Aquitalea sp. TaxID=540272 RepID=UPI0025D0C97A|nr:hypothetical protein [uncultured Aquitalea sp.]
MSQHQHQHGHDDHGHHHHEAHQHLTSSNFRMPFSLLAMSVAERLLLSAAGLGVLWLAVLWALREAA